MWRGTCREALGCRYYGLFDFRVDPEALYCSFARKSVVVVMAEVGGTSLTS
jgi:D-alanine-D-alanine ligase